MTGQKKTGGQNIDYAEQRPIVLIHGNSRVNWLVHQPLYMPPSPIRRNATVSTYAGSGVLDLIRLIKKRAPALKKET